MAKDPRPHSRLRRTPFWDATIDVSAIELGCTTVWSKDLNPGQVYDRAAKASPTWHRLTHTDAVVWFCCSNMAFLV